MLSLTEQNIEPILLIFYKAAKAKGFSWKEK